MGALIPKDYEMAKGKYEGSKADNAKDRAMAKRSGVSAKKFENSAADRKMDKAGQRMMNRRGK
jgi:hypothetical protein